MSEKVTLESLRKNGFALVKLSMESGVDRDYVSIQIDQAETKKHVRLLIEEANFARFVLTGGRVNAIVQRWK